MMIAILWFCLALDTPIIENDAQPGKNARNLVFEEDLRFGGGDEDVYVWTGSNPTTTADPPGNIYVADTGSNRVLMFNSKGKFLKEIGRQGEGPGEYRMLNHFTVFTDGSAAGQDVMGDSTRFLYYDKNMNYSHYGKREEGHIYRSHFSPDGRITAH